MNSKKFSEAMGELNSRYIDEAISYKKKARKPVWVKWGAIAAGLCLIAGAAVLLRQNLLAPEGSPEGFFTPEGIPPLTTPGKELGGGIGESADIMYSIAVYPATESEENVASADVRGLTENEALDNPLAEHLPKQLPEGFHYGRGLIYTTIMKDGTQYQLLRIEYISGTIPEQKFTEDGAAIAPDPDTIGEVFTVCVMNYKPRTDRNIYSSDEEITVSLLEENEFAYIDLGGCYVGVFTETAEPEAVFEALRNIG